MCTIQITSVIATPVGTGSSQIKINGTATFPDCSSVHLVVRCGTDLLNATGPVQSDGTWTATPDTNCSCHETISITVSCANDPSCTPAIFNGPLSCDCCPSIKVAMREGPCDAQGNRLIYFDTTITIVPQCAPVTMNWHFGDGMLGAPHTFNTAGSFLITDSHAYNPNNSPYVASLVISTPIECPQLQIQVDVPACPPPECCPVSSTVVAVGDCDAQGKRPITFTTTVTVKQGCPPITVQRDFGDGHLGSSHSFNSSGTFTETHVYSPATAPYNSFLNTLTPSGCASSQTSVTVPACPTKGDSNGDDVETDPCKKGILAWLCPLLQIIYLYSLGAAVVLVLVGTCLNTLSSLYPVIVGFFAQAMVAAVLIYLICRKCVRCGFVILAAAVIYLIAGLTATFFMTLPLSGGCCTSPTFLAAVLGLIASGLGLLFLWKLLCKRTWCDVLLWLILIFSIMVFGVPLILLGFVQPFIGCLNIIPWIIFGGIFVTLLIIYIKNNCDGHL